MNRSNHYVLEVQSLCKSFAGKKIINDVSFQVQAGDIYGFLGPNGAGKTTIIRMILNLIHLDSGKVTINGLDIKKDFDREIKTVGAIVETPKFHEYLSAYENLKQIANLHPEISNDWVHEVLTIVGLKERARDKVGTYSLGMKQRLGLAIALINKPKIIFLDEPTNGLDPKGMIEIRELIKKLASEQKITFFITTHMLHEVEQICNKVAIIQKGRLIAQDYVSNLLNRETETVMIETDASKEAIEAVKSLITVKNAMVVDKGLKVEIDKGCSRELINVLSSNQIDVDYVYPLNQTLEQFFIELTGGESHA